MHTVGDLPEMVNQFLANAVLAHVLCAARQGRLAAVTRMRGKPLPNMRKTAARRNKKQSKNTSACPYANGTEQHVWEVRMSRQNGVSQRGKRIRGVLVATAALLVVVVAYAILCWGDPRARKGYYQGKSEEEIRSDLDEQVDWYAMEISVASVMEMDEGQTRAEARLENVVNNQQASTFWQKDMMQYVDLAHPLPVGSNKVTVEFQGYEQQPTLVSDEGQLLGHDRFGASAAAEVTILVRPSNVSYDDRDA